METDGATDDSNEDWKAVMPEVGPLTIVIVTFDRYRYQFFHTNLPKFEDPHVDSRGFS